jgi:tetratricopeptide (TPR) repeat protein
MKRKTEIQPKHFIFLLLMLFSCISFSENFFRKISSSLNLKGEKDFKKAEQFFANGNYMQAAALYKKYLKKNKKEPLAEVNYKVAVCYFETGNPETAYPFIEKAYNLNKGKLEYQLLYAECLISLKEINEGINVYKEIVKTHPNDYLSYIRLGELLISTGNLTDARSYWKKAIEIDDSKSEAYSLMAESYFKVEKNKLEAYYYARKLYDRVKGNKKQEVEGILNRIAGKFRSDFENQYLLRVCVEDANKAIKKGAFVDAYNSLIKCKNLTDISDTYLKLLAETCEKLQKYKEAASSYEKCIAIGYEKGEYYYKAAINYLKINEIDTAKVLLKKAVLFKSTKEKAQKRLNRLKIKR